MFQVQLINTVIEWEHRIKMEEERQNNLRGKSYEKNTAAVVSSSKDRKPSFAQRFRRDGVPQPARRSAYEQYER